MIYLFKPHALHASSYLLKSHATLFISCHKITGVHRFPPSVQRVKISPPMTSCSPCGVWPFDVNLCRNRRLHEENNFIWGSLCLGSQVFLPPLPPPPHLPSPDQWGGNHYPTTPLSSPSLLFLLSCFSFTEKEKQQKTKKKQKKKTTQLSIFTHAPRNSSSHPCILSSHHISTLISPFSP